MKIVKKVFIWLTLSLISLGLLGGIGVSVWLYQLSLELPENLTELHEPKYNLPTLIYDRDGNQVDELFVQRRIVVEYEQFPSHLIQALIASEDSRFFYHFGFDPIRMLKAFFVNLKAQRFVQGASTITQQTARLFLLTQEKKLVRKLKELLLAFRIERQFTKEEIVTLYFNKVFFGNAEGVEASAQNYFGKHTEDLSLSESALLVGVLPAPSLYSPRNNPHLALRHRNIVLARMEKEGFISAEERERASNEEIKLSKASDASSEATSYYVEHVRRYLLDRYGFDTLYKGGLKVHLAMDLDYQLMAHEALREGIEALDRRQGYRGPLKHIDLNDDDLASINAAIDNATKKNKLVIGNVVQGVVKHLEETHALVNLGQAQGILEWSRLKSWSLHPSFNTSQKQARNISDILTKGDLILVKLEDLHVEDSHFRLSLHQKPQVNGAIVSMEPKTGHVLAMSGGYEYKHSEFNRATQAKRQPGSAFKPIVYAAALDSGYTLASRLVDSPRYYKTKVARSADERDEVWTPKNYGNKLLGEVSLKKALVKSLNLPTIGLVEDLGPKHIINYSRKLGITAPMAKNLTIGLGSFSLTLEEMTRAFGVFANQGNLLNSIFIKRVEDRYGQVLEENLVSGEQVVSSETAFLVTDTLLEVVQRGTGRAAQKIERPSAGKTGTTNNSVDAWYIGYVPQVLTGVYVGFDKPTSMGRYETGSRAAAPIWVNYMKQALEGLPTEQFSQPPGIVSAKIHKSGRRAIPCDPYKETYYENFKEGTIPPVDPLLAASSCRSQGAPSRPSNPAKKLSRHEDDLEL